MDVKILLVDDSSAMRRIIKRYLFKAGYENHEYLEAGSPDEAREIFKMGVPDLMFLDINMPGETGLEFAKSLQNDNVDFTFGIVSTEDSEAVQEEACALGARFVLHKPFTTIQMKTAVEPVVRGLQHTTKMKAENKALAEKVAKLQARIDELEASVIMPGSQVESKPSPEES